MTLNSKAKQQDSEDAAHEPLKYSAENLIQRKHAIWPEASTKAGDLVVRLFRLRDLIHDSSRREVKEQFGLTPAEFEVVVTLRTVPPPYALTPTELRQSMLITPGGLTKVMRNLEQSGYVCRKPSGHDRRSWLIELTDDGGKPRRKGPAACSRQLCALHRPGAQPARGRAAVLSSRKGVEQPRGQRGRVRPDAVKGQADRSAFEMPANRAPFSRHRRKATPDSSEISFFQVVRSSCENFDR